MTGPSDDPDRVRHGIDEAYPTGYVEHPLDEPDERGDLASFREAVGG